MRDLIAPSILSADFAKLGEDVQAVIDAGADWIHIDVMDNHYVPNLTIGPMVCRALRDYGIKIPFDVHLMIEPVDTMVDAFVDAGANIITFHPEASKHPHRTLQLIHAHGVQAGIVLNPGTSTHWIHDLIDELDMVLLMSVNPGFGGQQFIASVLEKITRVRQILDHAHQPIRLEVDGGININNIGEVKTAGADTFVMGSAIFNSQDYADTIAKARSALAD